MKFIPEVGQEVYLVGSQRFHGSRVVKVSKVTKTGFFVNGKEKPKDRFSLGTMRDHSDYGDGWNYQVWPSKEAYEKYLAEQKQIAELRAVIEKQLKTATIDQLESVAKIFEQ